MPKKESLLFSVTVADSVLVDLQERLARFHLGGHLAALERPEALAREIREFFRPLRG